jgi:ketosteroid isomerase-like protein
MRGDKAALALYWSPGATYRLAGLAEMLPGFPVGPSDAQPAVHSLVDLVQFHKLEKLDALVDGLRAAVHWKVTFSTQGRPPATTELYDLWHFDEDGKVASLLQFTDTALLSSQLS